MIGHVRRFSVIDGFQSLRHHAVIGSHDQHHDVGHLRSARTHAGEGFVTGRIEEDDLAAKRRRVGIGDRHLVRADVLRNSTGFAARDIGRADSVEQAGLAVVDVAHDGDHRGTRNSLGCAFFARTLRRHRVLGQLLFEGDDRRLGAEVTSHIGRQVGIERLVDGGENASCQQARDKVLGANSQLLGQVFHADAFRNRDAPRDGQRLAGKRKPRRRNKALHRAFLHTSRNIALSRTRRTTGGTLSRRRRRSNACDRLRTPDGHRALRNALDVDHGALPDAPVDVSVLAPALHLDADAGRSACHAPACRLAERREHRDAVAPPAEPGIPDAVRSGERSNGAAHAQQLRLRLSGTRWQAEDDQDPGQAVQDGRRRHDFPHLVVLPIGLRGTSSPQQRESRTRSIADVDGKTSLSSSAVIWSSITGSEGCAVASRG